VRETANRCCVFTVELFFFRTMRDFLIVVYFEGRRGTVWKTVPATRPLGSEGPSLDAPNTGPGSENRSVIHPE